MNALWTLPQRLVVLPLFVVLGGLVIALLSLLLTPGGGAAVLLLDLHATPPPNSPFVYPLTVQNLMHMLFFVALGELYCRWRIAARERAMLAEHLLPEDYQVVLQSHDLPPIRERIANRYDGEHGFLPSLIDLCILQFQASRSVDQTVIVLNSSMDRIEHRLDLRYAMLRYIVWVIPTIGFIGTVIGISLAMGLIDPQATEQPLGEIAQALGVAFYTTLVALVESAILVLLLNLVQAGEEAALNDAGHYTLTNLINRLYAGAEVMARRHRHLARGVPGPMGVAIGIGLCLAAAGAAADQLTDHMHAATVRVFCIGADGETGTGSGLVVGHGRYVISNWHVTACIGDGGRALVLLDAADGDKVDTELLAHDAAKDLALLRLERPSNRPSVRFATVGTLERRDEVTAVGFPGPPTIWAGYPP